MAERTSPRTINIKSFIVDLKKPHSDILVIKKEEEGALDLSTQRFKSILLQKFDPNFVENALEALKLPAGGYLQISREHAEFVYEQLQFQSKTANSLPQAEVEKDELDKILIDVSSNSNSRIAKIEDLHDPNPWVPAQARVQAVGKLEKLIQADPKIISEEIISNLLVSLGDSNSALSWAPLKALRTLSQVIDSKAIPELLIKMIAEQVVPALSLSLNNPNRRIRSITADGLINFSLRLANAEISKQVISALSTAFGDSDWDIRQKAGDAFVKIAETVDAEVLSKYVIPLLSDILRDPAQVIWHPTPESSEESKSLQEPVDPKALYKLIRNAVVEVFAELSKAIDPKVVSEHVIPALVLAFNHSDTSLRSAAVEAFVELSRVIDPKIVSEQIISILKIALKDTDVDVCRIAGEALVKLSEQFDLHVISEEFSFCLLAALRDANPVVRRNAANDLRNLLHNNPKLISEAVISVLITVFKDSTWDVRRAVIDTLSKLVPVMEPKLISQQLTSFLISELGDPDWNIRWKAVGALGKLPANVDPTLISKQIIPGVLAAFSDINMTVRSNAAKALGKLSSHLDPTLISEKIIPLVLEDLRHSDVKVAKKAIQAFSKLLPFIDPTLISEKIIPLLLHLSDDEDCDCCVHGNISGNIIDALEQLALYVSSNVISRQIIPSLSKLLTSGQWDIRKKAVDTLEKLLPHADVRVISELVIPSCFLAFDIGRGDDNSSEWYIAGEATDVLRKISKGVHPKVVFEKIISGYIDVLAQGCRTQSIRERTFLELGNLLRHVDSEVISKQIMPICIEALNYKPSADEEAYRYSRSAPFCFNEALDILRKLSQPFDSKVISEQIVPALLTALSKLDYYSSMAAEALGNLAPSIDRKMLSEQVIPALLEVITHFKTHLISELCHQAAIALENLWYCVDTAVISERIIPALQDVVLNLDSDGRATIASRIAVQEYSEEYSQGMLQRISTAKTSLDKVLSKAKNLVVNKK